MQDLESRERGRSNRRRHADAVDKPACRMFEIVDQRPGSHDVAAASGERLRQGSHPDVDLARIDAKVFEHAQAPRPQNAETVRVVDHQPRLAPGLHCDQRREVADVAIHAVVPLRDDQHPLISAPDRLQHRVERRDVVVRERAPLCARQLCAHDDAVVGERIVDDEIARADQGADCRHVGGVSADKRQACVLAIVVCKRRLQRAVDRPLARDKTAGRSRYAIAIDRRMCGRPHRGMMVQTRDSRKTRN